MFIRYKTAFPSSASVETFLPGGGEIININGMNFCPTFIRTSGKDWRKTCTDSTILGGACSEDVLQCTEINKTFISKYFKTNFAIIQLT